MIKFRSNSRIAACLHPPATPELDAANGLPAWILLDTRVYFADRQNFTTAKAETSKGHAIQLSICFAHPPALSYVCIHCPDLQDADFADEPRVIRSEKQFLLLHLPMNWSTRFVKRSSEYYYIYQAIPGKPALSRIPPVPGRSYLLPYDLGIYCCNNNGEYMLAGLCPSRHSGYELHLYSSVSNGWTMKLANLERPPLEEHWPVASHKVILLGGSLLGWVDLWRGMMVCDVLSNDQYVRQSFIPLPRPMPGNEADAADHQCAWMFRDVTCIDGLLKLIEIEHFQIPDAVEKSVAPCDPDRTYDEWCFVRPPPDDPDKNRWPHKLVGWRAAVWNRVLSDDGWRKERDVHVDDILVENAHHSALLAQLGDAIVGNSTIMNLLPSFPTLSIHGDDVVHLNSKVRLDTQKAQKISIDMRNKTLKAMTPCPVVQHHDYRPHFPCVLSNHLSVTPALPQVVVQASKSENVNVPLHQIGYNGSHHEYANSADPSYDSYQQSLIVPLQQQPTYQPNWPHFPSWISSGPVNTQQPHPMFNCTAVFEPMVHPLSLNDHCLFQPPPQRSPEPPPPFSTVLPSVRPVAAGNPVLGSSRRSPHQHSPYQRRRRKFWPPLVASIG